MLKIKEEQQNIIWRSSLGLSRQQDSCLRRYNQTYCAVTHTANGAHIVRTPGIAYASPNYTFGGIIFRNSSSNSSYHKWDSNVDNIWGLKKNHRYFFCCHIKGYSENDFGWANYFSNNIGWGGGGLMPSPRINASYYPSLSKAGINGVDTDIWLDFTITDDIIKTCTTGYSQFVQGQEYLSYMELGVGFTYSATGTLGTDIYVSNPRMYDITDIPPENFNANGTIKFSEFIELGESSKVSINIGNELICNSIIER